MKPGYKQTEVGVIPEEWAVSPFSGLFNITAGGDVDTKRSQSFQDSAHPHPIYSNALTNSGLYGYCSYADHPANSITITARGMVGGANFRDHPYTAIGRVLVLQPKNEMAAFYFAEVINNRVKFANESTGVPQLTAPQISKYRLPIPPPPEQRAIATALSDVDGLLGGLDRLIAKKRDLKQAAMQQLLTGQTRLPGFHGEWEVKRLDDVAEVIDPHPSHRAPNEVSNGVPFLGIGDIDDNGNIVGTKLRYVDRLVLIEHAARYNLNDQLIGLGRVASIGKVVCLKPLPEAYAISPTLGIIRGRAAKRNYLLYALRSKFITEQFTRIMSGSTRSSVGMEVLRKLSVLLPPSPEEQTAIAEVLTDMDAELAVLEQRRDKTRALKQAMMQELLTGRTRLLSPEAGAKTEVNR